MTGEVGPDATVRIRDPAEANAVYGKGFFGTVDSDGGLRLDRYESVYLAEMGRIDLPVPRGGGLAWPGIFRRAVRADPGFPVRYLVYRDLRQRGYVVRASPPPVAFAVLPRGGIPNKTPSRFWVEALSEREPFDLARVFDLADAPRERVVSSGSRSSTRSPTSPIIGCAVRRRTGRSRPAPCPRRRKGGSPRIE